MVFNLKEFEEKVAEVLLSMSGSSTNGLVIIDTLLLPRDDKGLNEKMRAKFVQAFKYSNQQKDLASKIVADLEFIRESILQYSEARQSLQDHAEALVERLATVAALNGLNDHR